MKETKAPTQKSLPNLGKTLGSKPKLRRYFQAIRLERDLVPSFESYPFSMPSIRHLTRLEFHPSVIFFCRRKWLGKIDFTGSDCGQSRI